MIGKTVLIRIEEHETNVKGVQREVEAIILDKVIISKEIKKWGVTIDGYYGNSKVEYVVSVTNYLVQYELNNRNRIITIYPLEIIKIL